jgi:hypothetical protein
MAKTIGTAEVGAYLHVNNGGTAKIKAYHSTNKPVKVDAADLTKRIAHKRYRLVEEEIAEAKSDCFYEKEFENVQEEAGKPEVNSGYKEDDYEPQVPMPPKNGEPGPLQVLKNFVDNIAADVRNLRSDFGQDRTAQWIMIAAALAVGIGALVLGLR